MLECNGYAANIYTMNYLPAKVCELPCEKRCTNIGLSWCVNQKYHVGKATSLSEGTNRVQTLGLLRDISATAFISS